MGISDYWQVSVAIVLRLSTLLSLGSRATLVVGGLDKAEGWQTILLLIKFLPFSVESSVVKFVSGGDELDAESSVLIEKGSVMRFPDSDETTADDPFETTLELA